MHEYAKIWNMVDMKFICNNFVLNLKCNEVMNKKRIILLFVVALVIMPLSMMAKEKSIKIKTEYSTSTRVPLEAPFEIFIDEGKMLRIHFLTEGTFTLKVEMLDDETAYVTTVTAVSGQDVFIDLKQLPSETYLLTLKNERLEATGYLIL